MVRKGVETIMSELIPWGQKKGPDLEFLGRDNLERPEKIGREVVAMLNAEGGTVWVGLREEKGRAVAVEPIADAETERRRLRDYLADTIEPLPADEIDVCIQDADVTEKILSVHVRPWESRRPYAHLERGGRFLVVRIGDRTRPMAREEIFGERGVLRDRAEGGLAGAVRRLLEQRERLQASGAQLLHVALRPGRELDLDIAGPDLADLLQEPRRTGNRRAGWIFRDVEARPDGELIFQAPLGSLHFKGEPKEIWSTALLELPVSACRIARAVYEGKLQPADVLAADLALIGARGWKLRPGSSAAVGPRTRSAEFDAAEDLVLERPLVFTFGELAAQPDRCGYRLVERVYEAFGYRRDAIPREFDARVGRLVLSE